MWYIWLLSLDLFPRLVDKLPKLDREISPFRLNNSFLLNLNCVYAANFTGKLLYFPLCPLYLRTLICLLSPTPHTDGYHYQQSKLENRQWEESGEEVRSVMAREREERLMGHAISPWSAIATETSGIVGGRWGSEGMSISTGQFPGSFSLHNTTDRNVESGKIFRTYF